MSNVRYLPVLFSLLSGCALDEGFIIENMTGTVVIPEEAATRSIKLPDGTVETITDVRLIGPVFLGLYSEVEQEAQAFPYPTTTALGDTFPYGGTTMGDYRYACAQALQCKMVSNRFVDFDSIVDWFNNYAYNEANPLQDAYGREIKSGDYLRDICFEYLGLTNDAETRIVATDRDQSGAIDEGDLDFVLKGDGKFYGTFTIWQQEYFDNQTRVDRGTDSELHGFSLWGFMDAPDTGFSYRTCNRQLGYKDTNYTNDYFAGAVDPYVLNNPINYIEGGDYVTCNVNGEDGCDQPGYVYSSPYDTPELFIDKKVE